MFQEPHGGDVYRHPGVLDYSTCLNPLGTPYSVIRAAQESMAKLECYPDITQAELKRALAKEEGVSMRNLILGNGAAELIYALVLAMRPRRALMAVPTFSEYERALLAVNCAVDHYVMYAESGFRLDMGFAERIREDTDMVFLCNPNNPTGQLIEPEILQAVRERCRVTGTLLFVDECFLDFVDDAEKYSLLPSINGDDGIFILKAFTKRYSIPGLRLGYGICESGEILDRMQACLQPWNVSVPAQAAGIAALKENDFAARARKVIREERAYLADALRSAGLKVWPSAANYIFFFGQEDLAEKLLQENVLIRDCSNYEGLIKGYYRVSVRTHDLNMCLVDAIRRSGTRPAEGEF